MLDHLVPTRRLPRAGALGLLLALSSPATALRAQPFDLSVFTPPPGRALAFTLPDPSVAPHGTIQLGWVADFAQRPFERRFTCFEGAGAACAGGATRGRVEVAQLARSELSVNAALFDRLSLGFALPVSVAHVEGSGRVADTSFGFGDLRLALAASLVTRGPTRVGAGAQLTLPSGAADAWSSDPRATLLPSLFVSQAIGRATIGVQAGYHMRRRHVVFGIERDDALLLVLGAHVPLSDSAALIGELQARLGVGGRSFRATEQPAELDLGLRLGARTPTSWQLDLGVGSGAWNRDAAGAPAVRGFLIVRKAFESAPCPFGPEDFDGFADHDGCADPDNDRDRIPDERDQCENDAEDYDGFADADGCPDLDNDADGLRDARDLCPMRSEDRDGFQDQDGCPEPDNDADGIADGSDRCRLDPEDRDGFEDDDGCPEPGPGRPSVTVSGSRLLMSDRVYFEDEADTIRPVSTPALDALAETVKSLPGQPRVRVEGHTDDSGSRQYNVDLSYRRARAVVEYLKAKGVPAEQLEHVGRGSAFPIAPNTSPEGRALNRRVEFVLIDR